MLGCKSARLWFGGKEGADSRGRFSYGLFLWEIFFHQKKNGKLVRCSYSPGPSEVIVMANLRPWALTFAKK